MKQKIYITKYALTKGIIEEEAEIKDVGRKRRGKNGYAYISKPGHTSTGYFGDEFHLTRAEAVAQANKMVEDKLLNLAKQSAKLRKLKFE